MAYRLCPNLEVLSDGYLRCFSISRAEGTEYRAQPQNRAVTADFHVQLNMLLKVPFVTVSKLIKRGNLTAACGR